MNQSRIRSQRHSESLNVVFCGTQGLELDSTDTHVAWSLVTGRVTDLARDDSLLDRLLGDSELVELLPLPTQNLLHVGLRAALLPRPACQQTRDASLMNPPDSLPSSLTPVPLCRWVKSKRA